jgi:TonB family protein
MKYVSLAAFLCCALSFPESARAQTANPWIKVSSDAEYFSVSMPHQPKEENFTLLKTNFGDFEVRGRSYKAGDAGARFTLWVITHPGDPTNQRDDPDTYLDATAELIWEGLLKPERETLPDDRKLTARMAYIKELPAKPLPGREYTVTIGYQTGTVQFYVAESRIYALSAMNSIGAEWTREGFFSSFTVSPNVPGQLALKAQDPSEEVGIPKIEIDTSEVLRSAEVTQRARVLHKPEPSYTESARKFSITGTVILRAIFSSTGEVKIVKVMRKLPHGLTQRALNAARNIRFTPAQKDGRPVSMWMQLEYNFNLY